MFGFILRREGSGPRAAVDAARFMASLAGVLASLAAASGQELVLTNLTDPAPVNNNAVWDSGNDSSPSIATDGLGHWVCAWSTLSIPGGGVGNDLDILVARSTDAGATWTDPAYLNTNGATDTGHDSWPHVVTDGAGTWLAVWATSENLGGTIGTDLDIVYARSFDNGVTWTAPAVLASTAYGDGSESDRWPQLATDQRGTWICVWETDARNLGTGLDTEIFYAVSADNGATWGPTRFLNSRAQNDGYAADGSPHIATDGQGTWLCVWQSYDTLGGPIGNDYDILFASSTGNGATWSAQARLNSNAAFDSGHDQSPKAAAAPDGEWVVVWESDDSLGGTIGTDADILWSQSPNGSFAWSPVSPLNTNAGTDQGNDGVAEIVVGLDGMRSCIWSSSDSLGGLIGVDPDILITLADGQQASWSEPTPLNTTAYTDDTDDRISVTSLDGLGRRVTAWKRIDYEGGPYGRDWDVFGARYRVGTLGDLDGDGDVDLSDFTIFQLCFGGSGNPPAPTCPAGVDADFDDDGDVDLADFLSFQRNFTGSR